LSTEQTPGASDDPRLACHACGDIHAAARLVELPDGRVVGNYSKAFFLHNEAVWVLRSRRSKRTRMEYLAVVETNRGRAEKDALREEMLKVYEWKEKKKK